MVVHFPPAEPAGSSDDLERQRERHARAAPGSRGARKEPAGQIEPAGQGAPGHVARVAYLPGAEPTADARRALAAVEAVARADAAAGDGSGRDGAGGRDARGMGAGERGGERRAKRANNVAIHQLARRGMSRWELEQVLAKREVDPADAAAELDRLESVGLLDEAALAVSVVYTMHTRKRAGRSAIEAELRKRHLGDEVIADALAELDGDDERERAKELAVERARRMEGLDYEAAARRLSGFLGRRGYPGDVVREAVAEALADHPRGAPPRGGLGGRGGPGRDRTGRNGAGRDGIGRGGPGHGRSGGLQFR